MSKYLVTGGCGYIGCHLVGYLQSQGHSVRVLDNKRPIQGGCIHKGCEYIEGDMNDFEVLEMAFSHIDGCFHLAGANHSLSYLDSNGCGTKKVVEPYNIFRVACSPKRQDPVPVVYASTRDVYGDNADVLLSEYSSTSPLTAKAVEKLSTEYYARVVALSHHLPSTGLRLFDIYGPAIGCSNMYNNLVIDLVERIISQRPVIISSNNSHMLDLVYINDVCRFFLQAMVDIEEGASIYNVCSGKPINFLELVDTISTLCNTSAKICLNNTRTSRIHTSVGNPELASHQLGVRTITELSTGLREVISSIHQSSVGDHVEVFTKSAAISNGY